MLKRFSPKCSEPKTLGSGLYDPDTEELVKSGKRGQISDQLVELPMEHQIYDMIDAEGPKGLTVIEVCILISWFFSLSLCVDSVPKAF